MKMKRLILFVSLFLLCPALSWAACPSGTCYFSPSSVVTTPCTLGTPCTVAGAVAMMTTGDTALGLDGASQITTALVMPNYDNLTIGCVNGQVGGVNSCSIQAATGVATRVVHFNQAKHYTLSNITIDANNIVNTQVTCGAVGPVAKITCDGCGFIGNLDSANGAWINDGGYLQALELKNNWYAGAMSSHVFLGFYLLGAASGNVGLTVSGTGTITGSESAAVSFQAFDLVLGYTGYTAAFSGSTTINLSASSTTASLGGIHSVGASIGTMSGVTCNFTGSTGAGAANFCGQIGLSAITSTWTLTAPIVANMPTGGGGWGFMFGSDANASPANPNTITVDASGITINGNPYEPIVNGWITNPKIHNNTINCGNLCVSGKGSTGLRDYDNVFIGAPPGGAMRDSSTTNSLHANNTFISTGNGATCEIILSSLTVPTASTGSVFENNICDFGTYSGVFTSIGTTTEASSAILANNLYWTTQTPTNYWSWQANGGCTLGSCYSTAATWGAAHETGYVYADPHLTTSYALNVNSPAANVGANVCTTLVNSTDFSGAAQCTSSVWAGHGYSTIGAYGLSTPFTFYVSNVGGAASGPGNTYAAPWTFSYLGGANLLATDLILAGTGNTVIFNSGFGIAQ